MSLTRILRRAQQLADAETARAFAAAGIDLTPPQYRLLTAVCDTPGQMQTDLVADTGIDRSTLADITRRLIEHGLVQRRRCKDDARAYAVKATDAGLATAAKAATALRRVDEKLMTALGKHRVQVEASLFALCASLEQPAPSKGLAARERRQPVADAGAKA